MQSITYTEALDDWFDGRFDVPRSKRSQPHPDDFSHGITRHASLRARQRGIPANALSLLAAIGRTVATRDGCTLAYMGKRQALDAGHRELSNLAVIVGDDGTIISTYRLGRSKRMTLARGVRRQRRQVALSAA